MTAAGAMPVEMAVDRVAARMDAARPVQTARQQTCGQKTATSVDATSNEATLWSPVLKQPHALPEPIGQTATPTTDHVAAVNAPRAIRQKFSHWPSVMANRKTCRFGPRARMHPSHALKVGQKVPALKAAAKEVRAANADSLTMPDKPTTWVTRLVQIRTKHPSPPHAGRLQKPPLLKQLRYRACKTMRLHTATLHPHLRPLLLPPCLLRPQHQTPTRPAPNPLPLRQRPLQPLKI